MILDFGIVRVFGLQDVFLPFSMRTAFYDAKLQFNSNSSATKPHQSFVVYYVSNI